MIGNLTEQFLYERLPEAVINGDERGYIEAVISGYQDRLEDVRSYGKNLNEFWVPGGLPSPANNVILVDLTSQFGKSYTRSLDIQDDTPPDGSDRLSTWASKQLGLEREPSAVSNVRYGYDPLRTVDVDTLSYLAATIGTLLYQTDLLTTDAATRAAQLQLVQTWFPRLKIKGTAQSFEVLGRILGFEDIRYTPLWTRLSPRVPEDVGNPLNDPDFAASPEYFPRQEIGPFYDPFIYRDGPFFSWTGTASNGTNSTQFYSQTISGHNPWVDVVILGSLAGTNIPSVSHGTVTHPATGSYALAGGAPFAAAYVDCPGSSIRFTAIADGADFNGLYVSVETTGSLAVITVEDRLSAIKYRSSYFDLGLTADMNTLEDIFGSRGATTNKDLEANPTLTADGTAVSPYRPWVSGSIVVAETVTDWVTSDGSNVSTWIPRREANPAAPDFDRQLNMDAIVAAGVQVTQAFEEVRAATRLPRQSLAGFLIDNQVCYAPYPNQAAPLFVTGAGTSYVGSSSLSPLPTYVADIHVILPPVFFCSWVGIAGNTYIVNASYNFAPFVAVGTYAPASTGNITFYDPVVAFIAFYNVLTVGGPPVLITASGVTSGGQIPVSSEINPLNQNEYLYGIVNQPTSYQFGGSWNWSTGTYHFVTDQFTNVQIHAVWTLTSTEVIRPEPSLVVKSTGVEGQEASWAFSCQGRPEDETTGGFDYEVADDYPWRREIVVGGELVELDSYYAGTELAIQDVEEATAFVDQTASDIDVFGIKSANSTHPRVVWTYRSYSPGVYKPGYTAIGYSGTLKNLSSLTALETGTIKPPIGPSKGDTETDYDTLFQPGYSLYHVGLAQGVLVADLPKFFGPHHANGLQAWFAFNEHIDDNLTVVDHGFRSIATQMFGLSYASRSFDAERGWHLNLDNAQVAANEYLDIGDEITASFWIRLSTAPTVESRMVDLSPIHFTLKPGGIVSAYSKTSTGDSLIGSAFVGDGQWHFVYLRRSGTNAVFGSGTLTLAAAENNVPDVYTSGDPDNDGAIYVQAFDGANYDFHDLRVWNVYKTEPEMDLVRYHAPNSTLCTYRMGFVYTLDREDKFGVKVLPSGWAYPDVLPAWTRRTRQALVLRYDSMGSYHGETRFKEVGMGDQRQPPDVYKLGQQFITMTGEGTAPFSTGTGAMPGWNPLWQATNYDGNYEVLPLSGSTATGIVPVVTASGTVTPWPNNMDQTNPFRQHVWVTANGSTVYQVYLENNAGTVFLKADPVTRTRAGSEIAVDPYLSVLLDTGTIYVEAGTGFVQGTLAGDFGTYGFYDPATATYYPKTFYRPDLYISEIPTGAYVLLSQSGSGILVANTQTQQGSIASYDGTNTTPLLYLYTPKRIIQQTMTRPTVFATWTDAGAATPSTQHMDVSAMPSLVTAGFLNTPCLGDAGVMEFTGNGTLLPGVYELTIASGQVGQADVDFNGFAVEIEVNDTVFDTRLLRGFSGYNFNGTDTFQFTLNDAAYGQWVMSIDWTNPLEDTAKGTKRQLAIYGWALRYLNMELFSVRPTRPPQITALTTDSFYTGTTPGGWFDTINSYGTSVGYTHEADVYTGNDTVTAIYPLGDTLTGLTNDRRNDIIYVGADIVVPDSGSFVFPSFGSTGTVSVYNPPQWFWAGALTTNPSATISAKMSYETPAVRVAMSETLDFGTRIYSDYVAANTSNAQMAKMKVEGLQPWTKYYYAVENAGSLYTDFVGTLTTFGTGARSFTFGVGFCENNTLGNTVQNNPSWAGYVAKGCDFLLHIGDLHYYNINTNDINRYRVAYNAVIGESAHKTFWSQHPVIYNWDDHDYGPNDSDSTAPGKEAARAAFRETVPHYPLAAGDGNQPIYFTFDVGRCRFIVTDLRSTRTPYTIADNPTKTVLGTEQKKWFKEQLLAANADPNVAVTFWACSFPWTGTGSPGAFPPRENWAAYPTERAEIATFIKTNNVQKLFIISGDMHAAAFDDGRTYDFSVDGTNPFPGGQFANGIPVFHGGPLYQASSSKGTPYMIGPMIVSGVRDQFGVVTVNDNGTDVLMNFTAYDGFGGTIVNQAGTYMTYALNGTASPRP